MTTPDPDPVDVGPVDLVDLGDGTSICWIIRADRAAWPWLVTQDRETAELPRGCSCCDCAPEQQLGALPRITRARISAMNSRRIQSEEGGT